MNPLPTSSNQKRLKQLREETLLSGIERYADELVRRHRVTDAFFHSSSHDIVKSDDIDAVLRDIEIIASRQALSIGAGGVPFLLENKGHTVVDREKSVQETDDATSTRPLGSRDYASTMMDRIRSSHSAGINTQRFVRDEARRTEPHIRSNMLNIRTMDVASMNNVGVQLDNNINYRDRVIRGAPSTPRTPVTVPHLPLGPRDLTTPRLRTPRTAQGRLRAIGSHVPVPEPPLREGPRHGGLQGTMHLSRLRAVR